MDEYYGIYLSHKVNALNLFPLITHQRNDILCDIGNNVRKDRVKIYNREIQFWEKKLYGYEKDCSINTRSA